jgi:hypothetical protein
MVNALEGRRREVRGVRSCKVTIWVALLAAILAAGGCSQGRRQDQGSGTTEAELRGAVLRKATMPNGQKYEDWLKD